MNEMKFLSTRYERSFAGEKHWHLARIILFSQTLTLCGHTTFATGSSNNYLFTFVYPFSENHKKSNSFKTFLEYNYLLR